MSDDLTVREYLKQELALPAGWNVIPEQRFPDTITTTTVVLQHVRIERLPDAPIGHLRHEVVLSVLDSHTDIATAEDALDDAVTEILAQIDGHRDIAWTGAEKVMHREMYPAWNITLAVLTKRTTPTEEV